MTSGQKFLTEWYLSKILKVKWLEQHRTRIVYVVSIEVNNLAVARERTLGIVAE
jgi:hypothetical protein